MKIKTIKKVITSKFDDFLKSITDENVRNLVRKNSLISGGCIATMLQQEQVNDYDIYFTNKETVLAVCKYYADIFEKETSNKVTVVDVDALEDGSDDQKYFSERGFSQPGRVGLFCSHIDAEETDEESLIEKMDEVKETSDSVDKYKILYISPNALSLSWKVQLILRFYGSPEEIHSNYDFVHCTNYWLSENSSLVLNQKALESIITKELIYIGSKYSMIRTTLEFTLKYLFRFLS